MMITGERIRFRGIERADLPVFVKWLNDPEVRQGILIYHPFSQAEEENWYEEMLKRPIDEHVLGIEVRLSSEQTRETSAPDVEEHWKLIGSLAFTNFDWRNRSSEFGIMIGVKTYWNQGYGTEAVRLLVRHGFDTLNLNRIFLHVFENNPRAIRAYEKAGFVREGRLRQAEFTDGKYIDILVMSILKDDYLVLETDHA
jgi:RimJ/RimL family protein N-acetyltransferase